MKEGDLIPALRDSSWKTAVVDGKRLGGSDQRYGRTALNCIAPVGLTGLHPFASLAAHDGVFNCPLMMIGDFSVMIALSIGCKANKVEADSRPLGDAGNEKTYDRQRQRNETKCPTIK